MALLGTLVVVAPVVGYAAGTAKVGDSRVARGTTVLGIDIGGLSESSAVNRLNGRLGGPSAAPLRVRAGGQEFSLRPGDAGLSLDAPATVKAATRDRWSLRTVWGTVVGGRAVAPRVKVDEPRLAAALQQVNARIGTPMREGRVLFRGTTPEPVASREGKGVDPRTATALIRTAYLKALQGGGAPPDLPIGPLRPKAGAQAVSQAASGPGKVAVSGPITLVAGEKRLTLAPKEFARYLSLAPDGAGALRPRVDVPGAAKALAPRLREVQRPARDAAFDMKSGKPKVVPSQEGREITPRALGGAISAAAMQTRRREAVVPLATAEPRVTTEEAGGLGVKEKISSFTTRYPCCAPRVQNIHTIAKILDGHVVRPGETFSLNGVVGKRDKARGFVEAPMILEGRYVDDVGGGVSQFATTMFNAVFFGGLQDVQHIPHSYYISRYPAGRESTVSFPQPDFRWRNDSPYGVLVDTSFTATSLTVTFWSTKRYDIESKSSSKYAVRAFESKTDSGAKCIPMPGAEGFQIDVWRMFKKDGQVVRRQKFHSIYQPEPRVTCGKSD